MKRVRSHSEVWPSSHYDMFAIASVGRVGHRQQLRRTIEMSAPATSISFVDVTVGLCQPIARPWRPCVFDELQMSSSGPQQHGIAMMIHFQNIPEMMIHFQIIPDRIAQPKLRSNASPLWGSNPRPYAYEAHALPTELRRLHTGVWNTRCPQWLEPRNLVRNNSTRTRVTLPIVYCCVCFQYTLVTLVRA